MSLDDSTPEQVEQCNATGRTPVVFIHGLWLLPSSWDRWAVVFEDAGYTALTPGWPDDPETVGEANAHPEVFAGKSVGDVASINDLGSGQPLRRFLGNAARVSYAP